jgi:hypothetical protein
MTPILGIMASQISGHLSTLSYESIATATPSGTSTVTFSSIPSTYKHLQIRTNIFQGSGGDIFLKLNSTQGLGVHYIVGNGTSASGGYDSLPSGSNGQYFGNLGASSTGAQVGITDILDYTDTNKYKVARTLGGLDTNSGTTTNRVWLYSFLFDTTASITSITFYSASNFASGSSFALYGVKG